MIYKTFLQNIYSKYIRALRSVIFILSFIIIFSGVGGELKALANIVQPKTPALKQTAPRLLNYFIKWTISEGEARELAKWDMVVVDFDTQVNSPDSLKLLRKLNPNIIILAYLPSESIERNAPHLGTSATLRKKLYSGIKNNWWLRDTSGKIISWWPGRDMLNAGENAPWLDYLADFAVNELMASGNYDGIFYDSTLDSVEYFSGPNTDIDSNGIADSRGFADAKWQKGMEQLFSATRTKFKNKIGGELLLVGNGSVKYKGLNAAMIENFSDAGGFDWGMRVYSNSLNGYAPTFALMNANTRNTGAEEDYKKVRFGYAASLLIDNGYYSFDFGDMGHEHLWWYDEYNAFLGRPLEASKILNNSAPAGTEKNWPRALWRRDFEQGLVLLNSTENKFNVELGGEFEQIRGAQDSVHNSGLIVSELSINPQDAYVLKRPLNEIKGVEFANGSFVRVLTPQGKQARNGFFAFNSKYPGGTKMIVKNIDNGGSDEVLTMSTTGINIFYGSNGRLRGKINLKDAATHYNISVADIITGDNTDEIILSEKLGGKIRVFDISGNEVINAITPFGAKYIGGLAVDVADIDGDGKVEIVASTTVENKIAQIAIMDTKGKVREVFKPFPKDVGGVKITLANANGVGGKEIFATLYAKGTVYGFSYPTLALYSSFKLPLLPKNKPTAVKAIGLDGSKFESLAIMQDE